MFIDLISENINQSYFHEIHDINFLEIWIMPLHAKMTVP